MREDRSSAVAQEGDGGSCGGGRFKSIAKPWIFLGGFSSFFGPLLEILEEGGGEKERREARSSYFVRN
jgi:hypothetical protein